jgi:hypothetical protein
MFWAKVVKKEKTHILCSFSPPLPENRAVHEMMGKKYIRAKWATDDMANTLLHSG